ncbi:cutinase family protein [Nocardia cyriacigeorgica]|uniref:cutinase family protein n=1 Tax=Nocardia cyriacigeorgica TaxID=135487 RepID=UPI0024571E2B|nr:cutinase family protein [Nocardia cyriacigeorgica]
MALREFLARHRMASVVAAPAVLGVAAAVAATFALTSTPEEVDTQLVASVTECRDMVTISVAGRNDTPREGTTAMLVDANGNPLPAALSGDHNSEWLDPVVNAPRDDVAEGSYAAVYIAYPANMSSYEDAVNQGVANAKQVMSEIAAACPDTKFSIVGYSEGADVVRRVAMEVGHQEPGQDGEYGIVDPENVLGVVILADPGRSKGDGPFPGSEDPFNNPDGFDQDYQNGQKPVPGQGALPGTSGDFGALNGKIASFCSDGDLTCSAPENISLLNLAVNVGRQLNIDDLEREGLTPATGQDVAVVLGRIAMTAFADIASQPNWMASDETFLEVLLRVSDPEYKPGEAPKEPVQADVIAADQMSPLAYLPQKILNEIVGLIVTNQNTIPVILSDPYKQTLGPDHTGHHFDYWDDADPENGRPMTSAEYAAAWITHLAKQAQAGEKVDTKSKPTEADLAAAYEAAESTTSAAPTTEPAKTTTTTAPTATTKPNTTTDPSTTAPTTPSEAATTTPEVTTSPEATTTQPAPTTTQAPAETTEPTTTAPLTTTTKPAAPTTDARAEASN